jgi:lathosterol oxidase
MSGAGSGLFGTVDGSFFRCPVWVDPRKAPGRTPQVPPTWHTWASNVVRGRALLFSPNLIWLSIAAFIYLAFPYDWASARTLERSFVIHRLLVNLGVCGASYAFWELSLYQWSWASRKFKGAWGAGGIWRNGSWPTFGRVAHNAWYWLLGVAQATAWEVAFCHLYATGKLPHVPDNEALSTPASAARFLMWTALVPVWRGGHFYFTHRFIHIRPLYKFVHSLHHRNIDIEPLAGLAMHPAEHAYYFSCLGLSLYFRMSPFMMTWNLAHLTLSPAASHSGWEDHTQSDIFHYLHHAKFECNYGSASFPLDHLFGTFRDRIGDAASKTDRGGASASGSPEARASAAAAAADPEAPAPYEGLTTKVDPHGFGVCMASVALLTALLAREVTCNPQFHPAAGTGNTPELDWYCTHPPSLSLSGRATAAAVAFGPILVCLLLCVLLGDTFGLLWPFHKEPRPQIGLHLIVGFVIGVLPVYQTLSALLETDAQLALRASAFCLLHDCQ